MSDDPARSDPPVFERTVPALLFLALTALLALHHWYAVTQGSVYFMVLFAVPMLWTLSLAAIFYPPLLYSIGKYGRHLPTITKVSGALIAFSGLGLGFCLAKFVYGMF